jgi:hypothetical protein
MQILSSIPLTSSTIICGDINARMGKRTGDSRWNTRGTKFNQFISQNNLYNWNSINQYGVPTRINYFEQTNSVDNSIVDYFITQADLPQAQLCIRTDLAVLGSDHKLMIFSFMWDDQLLGNDDQPQDPFRKRWKINRLLELPVYKEYIITMQRQFYAKNLNQKSREFINYLANCFNTTLLSSNSADNIDTIESLTEQFYDCIYYSLDNILTPSDYRPKTWKWFWNKNLQSAANYRQACYTRWRKSVGFQKPLWWRKYKLADATLKFDVKKARTVAFQNFCDELGSDPIAAMPTIKRIVQSKTRSKHVFSSIAGPTMAHLVIRKTYVYYFSSAFQFVLN